MEPRAGLDRSSPLTLSVDSRYAAYDIATSSRQTAFDIPTSLTPFLIRLAGFAIVLLIVAAAWLYLPSFAFSVVAPLH